MDADLIEKLAKIETVVGGVSLMLKDHGRMLGAIDRSLSDLNHRTSAIEHVHDEQRGYDKAKKEETDRQTVEARNANLRAGVAATAFGGTIAAGVAGLVAIIG